MTKTCTDEMRVVDVRQLHRTGHLKPGMLYWTEWFKRGTLSATLHTESRPDGLWVEYRTRQNGSGWHTFSRLMTLERTPCNLGGERVWWRCPIPRCGRRVALLFGGRELACRHCWGLTYRCRNETREDSAARQANKLRRRLGWPVGILNDIGGRPKGMHQTTYLRLLNEHMDRSNVALGHLSDSIERITARVKDSIKHWAV